MEITAIAIQLVFFAIGAYVLYVVVRAAVLSALRTNRQEMAAEQSATPTRR